MKLEEWLWICVPASIFIGTFLILFLQYFVALSLLQSVVYWLVFNILAIGGGLLVWRYT